MSASTAGPTGDEAPPLHVCGDQDLTGTGLPGRCATCSGHLVYDPAGVLPGSVLVCTACGLRLMGFDLD